jgi:hypothetical protein
MADVSKNPTHHAPFSFRPIVLGHPFLSKTKLASTFLIVFLSKVHYFEGGEGDQLFVRVELGFSMCRCVP